MSETIWPNEEGDCPCAPISTKAKLFIHPDCSKHKAPPMQGDEIGENPESDLARIVAAAEARGYERGRLDALAGAPDDNDYKRGVRDGNAEWSRVHNLGREEGDKKGFLRCREEAARAIDDGWNESSIAEEAAEIVKAIRSLKP